MLHIPYGYVGLFQPIDVGINKSLKSEVQQLWEDWMMDFGLSDAVTVPHTWLDFAEWVMGAYYLPEQIVYNAWMKKGYTWFNNGDDVKDRNGGVQIGSNNVFL